MRYITVTSLNRLMIYAGAKSKSEQIFSKITKDRLPFKQKNSTKFHDNSSLMSIV